MKTVFIILGILAVALLTFFAIGIVAIAWAHYPEGIIKAYRRRKANMKKKDYIVIITVKGDVALLEQPGGDLLPIPEGRARRIVIALKGAGYGS